MAYWTELAASIGPWISDYQDVPLNDVLLTSLPIWSIPIPSGADACRIVFLGQGAAGGTWEETKIYGINFSLTPTQIGGIPTEPFLWCQDLATLTAPVLGSSEMADGGFGVDDPVLVCGSLGVVTASDYYKAMDRAMGRAYWNGSALAYSIEQLETDTTTELLIGNLNGLSHLAIGLDASSDIAASGTLTAINAAVSFRINL